MAARIGCAVLGIGLLSACGASLPGTPLSAAPPSDQAAESAEPESAEPSAEEEAGPEDLEQLTFDQMMDVLVGPGDLAPAPDGHTTHAGVDYFYEEVAVEVRDYRDRFGASECTTAMDSINVELVGQDAEEGLMHFYQFSEGEEQAGRLYVWALAYDREVDTTEVWSQIQQHCLGTELRSQNDSVEIDAIDAGDFNGVRLHIQGELDGEVKDFTTFSVVFDAGENLVMMSSVGVDEQRFRDIVEIQEQKLTEFRQAAG